MLRLKPGCLDREVRACLFVLILGEVPEGLSLEGGRSCNLPLFTYLIFFPDVKSLLVEGIILI